MKLKWSTNSWCWCGWIHRIPLRPAPLRCRVWRCRWIWVRRLQSSRTLQACGRPSSRIPWWFQFFPLPSHLRVPQLVQLERHGDVEPRTFSCGSDNEFGPDAVLLPALLEVLLLLDHVMRISFQISLSFLNLKMQFHSQEFWEMMLSSDKSCNQISVERICIARYLSSGSLARFLNSRMELIMSINFLFFWAFFLLISMLRSSSSRYAICIPSKMSWFGYCFIHSRNVSVRLLPLLPPSILFSMLAFCSPNLDTNEASLACMFFLMESSSFLSQTSTFYSLLSFTFSFSNPISSVSLPTNDSTLTISNLDVPFVISSWIFILSTPTNSLDTYFWICLWLCD